MRGSNGLILESELDYSGIRMDCFWDRNGSFLKLKWTGSGIETLESALNQNGLIPESEWIDPRIEIGRSCDQDLELICKLLESIQRFLESNEPGF